MNQISYNSKKGRVIFEACSVLFPLTEVTNVFSISKGIVKRVPAYYASSNTTPDKHETGRQPSFFSKLHFYLSYTKLRK